MTGELKLMVQDKAIISDFEAGKTAVCLPGIVPVTNAHVADPDNVRLNQRRILVSPKRVIDNDWQLPSAPMITAEVTGEAGETRRGNDGTIFSRCQ